jgi:hypothetical protein
MIFNLAHFTYLSDENKRVSLVYILCDRCLHVSYLCLPPARSASSLVVSPPPNHSPLAPSATAALVVPRLPPSGPSTAPEFLLCPMATSSSLSPHGNLKRWRRRMPRRAPPRRSIVWISDNLEFELRQSHAQKTFQK